MGTLIALALIFAELSLLAFGGGNTILPEMQRRVVEVHHWMSAQEFSALFALAQAAPGPNMMVVPLIGWHVAGWSGLLVSSLAKFGPSSLLTGVVLGLWRRFRDRPWRRVVQTGLVPMTVGLVAASAALIGAATSTDAGLAAVTLVTAAASVLWKKLHPLWLLAGGAVAGLLGAVVG
ncbi:chromate transporter [Pseudoroseomonas ludipueritiae]|uniref:Chromate transporter n=1 Tax=Pseudoroseomonas ludipueritiae TaxID=198093 RepID=A0ABR7RE04_9PROT|nr:chromate transporter [Pseudoroseomonas ludipueritiae]MBC9180100.1 chromate transporter [Pseudoroseomonas ludipueritiae]MCG7364084.1 chromate transporter [Roseomonas sp. ACRSG]